MDEFENLPWRSNLVQTYIENQQTTFLNDSQIETNQAYIEFKTSKLSPPKPQKILRTSKKLKSNKPKNAKSIFVDYDNPNAAKSSLSYQDKIWYLNYLILLQNGDDLKSTNCEKFTQKFLKLKDKINEERIKFMDMVKERWNEENYKRFFEINEAFKDFADFHLKCSYDSVRNYPQFYQAKSIIKLSSNDDSEELSITAVSILCQQGNVPKFVMEKDYDVSELTEEYLNSELNIEPKNEIVKCSKFPVSMDSKAIQLATDYKADIVISLKTLKILINDTKTDWSIPVLIRAGDMKKMCFIDEPIANKHLTNFNKRIYCFKEIIRNFFCTEIAFQYNFDVSKSQQNSDEKHYHNVTYELWEIKPTNPKNILNKNFIGTTVTILIRSDLDCLDASNENEYIPLNLYPKIQLQPEFGSTENSLDDLLNQWTDLYFKKFSQAVKSIIQHFQIQNYFYSFIVHIDGITSSVMMVEKLTIHKLTQELTKNHNFRANTKFHAIYNLFTSLITHFVPANYVLRPSNQKLFLELLKEADKDNTEDNRIFVEN